MHAAGCPGNPCRLHANASAANSWHLRSYSYTRHGWRKRKRKKKSKTRTLCPPRRCQGQPWVERVKQLIGSMWQTGQEDELSGCVRSCRPTRISTVLIVYSFPLFFSRMLLFPDARAALDPVSIRNTMVEWAAAHGINWGPICTYYKTALRSIRPTKKKKEGKSDSQKKKRIRREKSACKRCRDILRSAGPRRRRRWRFCPTPAPHPPPARRILVTG
jgi:hypothetical protein